MLAHSDGIGSTTVLTDETGAVVFQTAFDPWGRLVQSGGPRPWFSFAGLQFPVNDPSYPSATREYNDGLGRWLTPDPDNAGGEASDSQSWNMYSYVGDNPTSRTDPSGLSYCKRGPNGKIALSTCVSDMAFPALDNKQGYEHISDVTTAQVTVNGSEATQADLLFALGFGIRRAAPVVNLANEGLRAFGYIVAPLPMAVADYYAGAPGSGKVGMALAILPDSFAAAEIAKIAQGLKPTAEGMELQAVINALYRDSDILPGGTAGAVRHELATGERVGGRLHSIKASNTVRWLDRLLSSGSLSPNDTAMARAIKADLLDALAGK